MSTSLQLIDPARLDLVCGGAGTTTSRSPHVQGINPVKTGGTSSDAPVFGAGGQLTPKQALYANAAAVARDHFNDSLRLSSSSGAVESRQWRAIKDAAASQ